MVNKAIALGLPPIQAIQMASCNAAAHFHLEGEIGSISPGRWADILLCSDLQQIYPRQVFYKGQCVAQDGRMVVPLPAAAYPSWLRRTVTVTRGTQAADFVLQHPGSSAQVRVIKITPDQIINKAETAKLAVSRGNVQPDPGRDLLKLAVVERYGKNGNIGLTFVQGFGLQRGAISSSVAHDHHNIVIVGADEQSMATCVRATSELQGGLVVACGGEVLASLPLPLAGLQSDLPPLEVIDLLEKANAAARSLGCVLPAPFMSLSFISLPTVPELGLTDKGLVDVQAHALISPFLEE